MAKQYDPFAEFFDDENEDEELPLEDISRIRKRIENTRIQAAAKDILNDIGEVIPVSPEAQALKEKYEEDYVSAHQEVFTESSGIKPLGPSQIASVERTVHVLKHGGKSVIAEPRGFGKTSRTSNNALMGVLQGKVKYVLILASSVQKAEDILESIKTELITNDKLYEMYPAICESFRHAADNQHRILRQTYRGERTFIGSTKALIRIPNIPGEPSAGSIIQVRSKDNVRGLNVKVRYGEFKGKVLRPDFVFMDDVQTDEEAESPTSVYKIVQTIKKSVLFAGTHARRISAVMCCTPICPGDVSSHFILNEPSWDCLVTKMISKMPKHLDKWLNEYARILLDFDRYKTGDRTRAQLAARKYVEENYEMLHEGAEWAWDWAFGWGEDPQTEISPLQHAMNFLIEEGTEAFESECQCNVENKIDEAEDAKATLDEILNKVHDFTARNCPVEATKICTHIDVNKNILTYVTMASPQDFRPYIIDYGTWPPQPGMTWKKRDLAYPLVRYYPDIHEHHERIYLGVKELVNEIGNRMYRREDGIEMTNDLILVDMGYMIDEVQRAIRDCEHRSITLCCRGQGIKARDKPFMQRNYEKHAEKHFHCATVPTLDRVLQALYVDVNYFKTILHKGFKTRLGLGGSISLFTPESSGGHLLYGKQNLVEKVSDDYYDKEDRHVLIWENTRDEDNEFFDNSVGCLAGFMKLGIQMKGTKKKILESFDIQDYVDGENNESS